MADAVFIDSRSHTEYWLQNMGKCRSVHHWGGHSFPMIHSDLLHKYPGTCLAYYHILHNLIPYLHLFGPRKATGSVMRCRKSECVMKNRAIFGRPSPHSADSRGSLMVQSLVDVLKLVTSPGARSYVSLGSEDQLHRPSSAMLSQEPHRMNQS